MHPRTTVGAPLTNAAEAATLAEHDGAGRRGCVRTWYPYEIGGLAQEKCNSLHHRYAIARSSSVGFASGSEQNP